MLWDTVELHQLHLQCSKDAPICVDGLDKPIKEKAAVCVPQPLWSATAAGKAPPDTNPAPLYSSVVAVKAGV